MIITQFLIWMNVKPSVIKVIPKTERNLPRTPETKRSEEGFSFFPIFYLAEYNNQL